MSDQITPPSKFIELRSNFKYYIDSYAALYQLKTENKEEISSIYMMIKTELIDSKKYLPQNIIRDILNIIPFNNGYTKSYLSLAKLISDEYHLIKVNSVNTISNFLFYKEYGIKLKESDMFEDINSKNLDILSENTIYKAIMYNDLERFIPSTERDGFNENKRIRSDLYPYSKEGYSLLELCCYYGAVDCFKFLITKFNLEITQKCLNLSFLGGNKEIMNECLINLESTEECMEYAIISHNIDFVTFLMNEYNIKIDLEYCGIYNNLESFLVYFDQTNDYKKCFFISTMFNIPSLCEYFLSHGVNINEKDQNGKTALFIAARLNLKEIEEFLLSHGANVNEKDNVGETALHLAALTNSNETAEVLLLHGANVDEKDNVEKTALHLAAFTNSKETAEVLLLHGANINEKDKYGKTALHFAASFERKEVEELLLSHGANSDIYDEFANSDINEGSANSDIYDYIFY
ncbi:hypothetical protein TVAG_104750 [Trichomonas vaginalis G3]|uniref:DUF3447 domain-containing protein n=1 Tax=Trichomonas vaginalis (strain ATCC PRA-98 / G3) TaxID=412133 RepID=A2FNU9_TRIV3|nr:proteasome regulatory particle assembly [Trichomonas vaginalis G3]EAX93430.1 hypothetical protein TVAG_104750 [Trichomonas vaginalis G3]KAI5506169.1 proteasome regulatory particle assembly [Trichomonas vaginalis G3]|eukprot:XP_001306360.1 hypothetical protein [Trichomonas vaginalis G3]